MFLAKKLKTLVPLAPNPPAPSFSGGFRQIVLARRFALGWRKSLQGLNLSQLPLATKWRGKAALVLAERPVATVVPVSGKADALHGCRCRCGAALVPRRQTGPVVATVVPVSGKADALHGHRCRRGAVLELRRMPGQTCAVWGSLAQRRMLRKTLAHFFRLLAGISWDLTGFHGIRMRAWWSELTMQAEVAQERCLPGSYAGQSGPVHDADIHASAHTAANWLVCPGTRSCCLGRLGLATLSLKRPATKIKRFLPLSKPLHAHLSQ